MMEMRLKKCGRRRWFVCTGKCQRINEVQCKFYLSLSFAPDIEDAADRKDEFGWYVLIVEDQKIMQKYFEYILMQDPEFRHVQTISDARDKNRDYSVIDLVIMDVQTFHNHDGLSAGKMIRKVPIYKGIGCYVLIDPKVLERAKSGCAGQSLV